MIALTLGVFYLAIAAVVYGALLSGDLLSADRKPGQRALVALGWFPLGLWVIWQNTRTGSGR